MLLLYYVIVSLRLAVGCTTSSRLVLLSSLAGETETLEDGNGGNSFCVGRDSIVRVLSDRCTSRAFALDFPERPLGGVAGTRPGVVVSIWAAALCFVGERLGCI